MKQLCKLTDQNMKTHNGFQWELGKKEIIKKKGGNLCSDSYFHCYEHPLLSVLLNPMHADIKNPRLFLIEVGGKSKDDNGLKCGFKEMTLIEEIRLPEITINQRIAFGILCALQVYKEESFVKWANDWLHNVDRSKVSASAAYASASASASAAYAAYAAYAASAYASAANAAYAAYASAYAERAGNVIKIDLIALAKKSLMMEKIDV